MSWKRRNPEKPSEEDDEEILEERIDIAPDILEVNDTEFLDEEALLQGGAEDDDVDEGANDELLEGDISGETRSARQKEAVEGGDIGGCKSDTLQSTVQELPVSPAPVCKEEAKLEKSQSDVSNKAEGTPYCEDKPSATLSFGPQKSKGGDSSEAAITRSQPAGRKVDTSSRKTSALEPSSSLAASEQPGKSLRGDTHRITSEKGETSGSAGRNLSSSHSGAASRGGRFSSRNERPDRAARCNNGLQQSRRDSRFSQRRPYSRGQSDSRGKQPRMPYAARPSIGMSQPSRSSFGTPQPYRQASSGPPNSDQPRMPYNVRLPVETSPPNRPAVSCDVSEAHLHDLLRLVIGATVLGPNRTPEMPAVETNSTFVGPVLGSSGQDSCSPGLATSGGSLQPSLLHHQWPLPDDRARVHNYSFEAASQLNVDSKGTAAVRQGAPTTSDGDNSSPIFSPCNPSPVRLEAAKQPTYLDNSGLSQRRLPSCEPRYEAKQPSSEMLQESALKSRVGHNETFKDLFPASREAFPNEGSLNYATQATRDVDVPKMRIDYNHGTGDCDYRIPAQPRRAPVAIGVGRAADLTQPGDREERTPSRRDGLSQDLARDGNASDSRHLKRCDTVNAGSKRRNPSGTDRAHATNNGTMSFNDPVSTYDDVKRARIGLNGATSLQSGASSAVWDVGTDGQSLARVARFSKSSTSNQAESLTENLSDGAPIKKSPNSEEYNKKLQEQLILRQQIMRRKEEQRRQEAERRRFEMKKSRENDDSSTPYDAGRTCKPDANKTEAIPRRSASSSQLLLRAELAEQPFRVPTLEASANFDDTAGTAGSTAATASARATAFAVTGSFRDAGSGAKARPPVAADGTASSGNVLLRERYRKLRLQAEQAKPVSNAALSTKSAPRSPHRESNIRTLSDGGSTGNVAALCASRVLPEPQRESSHRTLADRGRAGNGAAPVSPHRVNSVRTASDGNIARSAAAPRSPNFVSSIRTLSDGGNAGSAAALRTSSVLSGNRRQFGADEPMSPGCESAAVGPHALHRRREDFQPRPQGQWPQQESRHVLAVDSHSTNQSRRLLVDYGGGSTRDRSADLPSHRRTKVTIRNLSPSSTHLPLLLAAASLGKVVDVRSDDKGVVTLEFDAVESAVRFCQAYDNAVFDNAIISVKIEKS